MRLIPCLLLTAVFLAACTPDERRSLPQPKDGNRQIIDLRNDGYFDRLNTTETKGK
jgi:hypothetical protein